MTKRPQHIALILLICVLAACPARTTAQDEAGTAPEAAEPKLFEFVTAGFNFDIELPYEPVIRETTNSSIYAVTIQRRAADGLALGTDGMMAFARLSQTIDPLEEIGTIEDLDKATMDDAIRTIRKAFGEQNRLMTSACSMEILGEVRRGKRIDVGLLENGTNVYVECYSFVSADGNGVGVTIKYLDPVGDDIPVDVMIAGQLLSGLEVNHITPETSYIHTLAGYPIRIPVRSKVQNARRVNPYVTEATVAYEYGSLRFQTIAVPDGVDGTRVARDQLKGYEMALDQQRDRGQIEIMWDAQSCVPAGEHAEAVLPGLTHAIRMNGQEFLSTMYAAVDDQRVIVANFSGSIEHADTLSEYAYEFFKRPLSSAKPSATRDDLGKVNFERLTGLQIDQDQAGNTIYAPTPNTDSYTLVRVVDGEGSIESLLALAYPDGFSPDSSLAIDPFSLEDGREIRSMRVTGTSQDESGSSHATSLSGYLVPMPESETRVLLVAVSPAQAHAAQTIVTREFLDRFSIDANSSIDLGFATLNYDDSLMSHTTLRGGREEIVVLSDDGSLMIRIVPLGEDQDRSMDALNPSHLIPAWVAASPSQSDGESSPIQVTASTFLGREASVIESDRARVIGFVFDDSFVVITAQAADEGTASLDALFSMISSN